MPRSFEETINSIVERYDDYAPDAYEFLRQALDHAAQRFKNDCKTAHLTAEELYLGACSLALEEYGPLAAAVLQNWGINDAPDIGQIVFRLVEAGVFGKQDDDDINQFRNLPSMISILDAPYTPQK